jgi:hypothetical protein
MRCVHLRSNLPVARAPESIDAAEARKADASLLNMMQIPGSLREANDANIRASRLLDATLVFGREGKREKGPAARVQHHEPSSVHKGRARVTERRICQEPLTTYLDRRASKPCALGFV